MDNLKLGEKKLSSCSWLRIRWPLHNLMTWCQQRLYSKAIPCKYLNTIPNPLHLSYSTSLYSYVARCRAWTYIKWQISELSSIEVHQSYRPTIKIWAKVSKQMLWHYSKRWKQPRPHLIRNSYLKCLCLSHTAGYCFVLKLNHFVNEYDDLFFDLREIYAHQLHPCVHTFGQVLLIHPQIFLQQGLRQIVLYMNELMSNR